MEKTADRGETICFTDESRREVFVRLELISKSENVGFLTEIRPFFALLSAKEQLASDDFLIFAQNPTAPDGAVNYLGEQFSEQKNERRDTALIRLSRGALAVRHIVVLVAGGAAGFLERKNFRLKLTDENSGKEIAINFEGSEALPAKAAEIGRFEKKEGDWVFEKSFRDYPTGLQEFLDNYTV